MNFFIYYFILCIIVLNINIFNVYIKDKNISRSNRTTLKLFEKIGKVKRLDDKSSKTDSVGKKLYKLKVTTLLRVMTLLLKGLFLKDVFFSCFIALVLFISYFCFFIQLIFAHSLFFYLIAIILFIIVISR